MKLKFNKQKISSLTITSKLFGGDTHTVSDDRHTNMPTLGTACKETFNEPCTYSVDPVRCGTNDGTLKTWEGKTGFYDPNYTRVC